MILVKVHSGDGEFLEEASFDVGDAKEVAQTVRDAYGSGFLRYADGRVVVHHESLAAGNYVFRATQVRSKRVKINDMEQLIQQNLTWRSATLREENSIDQLPWPFIPMKEFCVEDTEDTACIGNGRQEDEVEDGDEEEIEVEDNTAVPTAFTLRLLDFSGNRVLKAIWGKTGQMKILERPCYKELWEKIKAYVEMFPNDKVSVLLRGSPGIGKTAFLLYVLVELVRDRKKALFRTQGGVLYYFGHDGAGIYHGYRLSSYYDVNLDTDPEIWFLADGMLPDPPVYLGAAILASTPLKTNYKEFEKEAKMKVFLPIWTASEMALLRQELFPGFSLEEFKELYRQWGGIPQRVLEDPSEDLSQVINGMPSIQQLVDEVLLAQAGSDHPSHQLLYMKVVEGYGDYDLMFASPFVKDAVYKKMHREKKNNVLLFLRFKGAGLEGIGCLKDAILQSAFETHAVGRRDYSVREVFETIHTPKAQVRTVQFQFGASKRIHTMEDAESGVYDLILWPENKIEESIDALKLKKLDTGEMVLQLFQATVSSHRHGHGIECNGVLKLMKKFGVAARNIELYVVTTPELFEEAGWHNWRIEHNLVLRDSKKLKGIRQFALEFDTA